MRTSATRPIAAADDPSNVDAAASSRKVAATVSPLASAASTTAAPMPLDAPVTNQTFALGVAGTTLQCPKCAIRTPRPKVLKNMLKPTTAGDADESMPNFGTPSACTANT